MIATISTEEFKQLRNYIERECSIVIGDEKVYLIESRLAKLLVQYDCKSYGEFYQKLVSANNAKLKTEIIDAVTTNETLWFRDESPYLALKEQVLPELAQQIQRGQKSNLRIWSAACSTGQEPYSIGMTVHEFARLNPSHQTLVAKTTIMATDICSSVLVLAQSGRYDPISMSRGMLPGYKERYFEEQGRVCAIKDSIKSMVSFQQFNLQQPFTPMGKFDVIFLRNVAIYFSPEFKTELFQKIANALNPGGYLFIGASETLNGYSTDFTLREYGRAMYYQVK